MHPDLEAALGVYYCKTATAAQRTWRPALVEGVSLRKPKPKTPMIAPALPAAAQKPCAVDRNLRGNTGQMVVIQWSNRRSRAPST